LSAVRHYSINEFILRFRCTVCTFGREDRECVMRHAAATKSNTNGTVHGLPRTVCTLYSYVHTSVTCVAKYFPEPSNRLNLITRRRHLLTDKVTYLKQRYLRWPERGRRLSKKLWHIDNIVAICDAVQCGQYQHFNSRQTNIVGI
jgi:hypothetical protein